jgi:uncharacterized protein YceK
MKKIVLALLGLGMVGCSSVTKEVSFAIPDGKDGVHYIVNLDMVNDRTWANQTQINGDFHCTYKRTSVEMAELRQKYGPNQLWHTGCTPLKTNPQFAHLTKSQIPGYANFWGDITKTLLWTGAIAYTGNQIGKGLGRSGDHVTQSGSGNSESNSESDANVTSNSGNKTTNIKGDTKINSDNVFKK